MMSNQSGERCPSKRWLTEATQPPRMDSLICLPIFLCLLTRSCGEALGQFVAEHGHAIEANIMAGYGGGWKKCDLLAISPLKSDLQPETSQFVMDMASLKAFDIRTGFSNSQCLLITAHVGNQRILAQIIEFGWTAVHHKRLGMSLRLGSNLTLDMATNITNLPFPIAAQLEGGKVQFLRPDMGESMPKLQSFISHTPHPTYSEKSIRVGLVGTESVPFSFKGAYGDLDGVSIRLISLLERKMKFKINYVTPPGTGIDAVIKG